MGNVVSSSRVPGAGAIVRGVFWGGRKKKRGSGRFRGKRVGGSGGGGHTIREASSKLRTDGFGEGVVQHGGPAAREVVGSACGG